MRPMKVLSGCCPRPSASKRFQDQRVARRPEIDNVSVPVPYPGEKREAVSVGPEFGLDASALRLPVGAEGPDVGRGWIVAALRAEPGVGSGEHVVGGQLVEQPRVSTTAVGSPRVSCTYALTNTHIAHPPWAHLQPTQLPSGLVSPTGLVVGAPVSAT